MQALFSSAVFMTELWLSGTWGSLIEGVTDPEAQRVQSIMSWSIPPAPPFLGLAHIPVAQIWLCPQTFSSPTTLHMHRSPHFPSAPYPHEDRWPAVFSSS